MTAMNTLKKLVPEANTKLAELLGLLKQMEWCLVPFECWVIWTMRASDDNVEWHQNHNLMLFRTEAEAKTKCDELNQKWKADQDAHPWWGKWEENGLHAYVDSRNAVPLYSLRAMVERENE